MVAVAVAGAFVLLAPFLGEVRRFLRASFPSHFELILGAALALSLFGLLAAAIRRIRDRRALRYSAIVAAVAAGAAYSLWNASPDPQVNAVERFHFLEYGVVTFLFYRAWRPLEDASVFVLPVLAGLMVGTLEEWFQWFIPVRVGEMRDVFLNGAAIGSGLIFSTGVDPPRSLRWGLRPGSLRRVTRLASAALLLFAAFVHSVHLGYAVTEPVAGIFHSRYDAGTLLALAADRHERWKEDPPLQRPARLSREDQYMSEGLLHVQERNERWDAGDIDAARRENLILERFYAPVLDTPSYVSASGHRWPPAQRADADTRSAASRDGNDGSYVSLADGGFIRTWPRSLFWGGVLLLAAALILGGALLDRRPAS